MMIMVMIMSDDVENGDIVAGSGEPYIPHVRVR